MADLYFIIFLPPAVCKTGAEATEPSVKEQELNKIYQAVSQAREAGLCVHVGHGLHYQNVTDVAAIEGVHTLNIGHSIIARSVFVGLQEAVREMKILVQSFPDLSAAAPSSELALGAISQGEEPTGVEKIYI